MGKFPILGTRLTVPFRCVAPYKANAQRNHGQSLERLAQRGGLTAQELLSVIEGRSLWQYIDRTPLSDRAAMARVREALGIGGGDE